MGYTTRFFGELKFTKELTSSQLAKVKSFLGEDCRGHPQWETTDMTWIDLEFLDDFSGIRWIEGSESTYHIVESVNLIIRQMKKDFPDFGLQGRLLAQGQDINDRWSLIIEDGLAIQRQTPDKVVCPHCSHEFIIPK